MVDDARSTVHKPPLGHEPSSEWKKKILMAEHSPIRDISVKWKWLNMPHWVTVHWVRHKFEKFVSTQRSDRTGIPRNKLPQDQPADFTGEANAQQLIDVWKKRLCRQASPETRKYAEDFKLSLVSCEPELSEILVPQCVYRGGCSEVNNCGFYDKLTTEHPELLTTDLQQRYRVYNQWFYSAHTQKTPLILLAGPSGCGKSTVAKILEDYSLLRSLRSFTTRPRRTPDEDTHTFLSPDEFAEYERGKQIIAVTKINGNFYGAIKQMADDADVYVIDPDGVASIPDEYLKERNCVYVWIECDEQTCEERMRARGTPEEIEQRKAVDLYLRYSDKALARCLEIPHYVVRNDGDPAACADEIYKVFVKETQMK